MILVAGENKPSYKVFNHWRKGEYVAAHIIDGKALALSLREGIAQEVNSLQTNMGISDPLCKAWGRFIYSISIIYRNFMNFFFSSVNQVRLMTLQMSIILLKQLVYNGHPGQTVLKDSHLAFLEVHPFF